MRVRVKRKKGRGWLITLICVSLLASVYVIMLLNTNPLVKSVERIYSGEADYYIGEWDNEVIANLDIISERPQTQKVEVKINRILALHTFNKGYMWVYVDCEATDNKGNATYGFVGFEKWKIAKTKSGWQITEISRKA